MCYCCNDFDYPVSRCPYIDCEKNEGLLERADGLNNPTLTYASDFEIKAKEYNSNRQKWMSNRSGSIASLGKCYSLGPKCARAQKTSMHATDCSCTLNTFTSDDKPESISAPKALRQRNDVVQDESLSFIARLRYSIRRFINLSNYHLGILREKTPPINYMEYVRESI